MDEAKNHIDDLEHKKEKKKQLRTRRRKKGNKSKDSVSSLLNNFKCSNLHIIGVPEVKEKKQEIGNLFEKNNERNPT